MKLLLLTAGTRGDVEPFAALARHAVRSGAEVALGVPDEAVAGLADVDAFGLGVDFSRLVGAQGVSPLAAARAVRTTVRPGMRRMLSSAVRAVLEHRPDVVVHHPKVLTAPRAADAVGVPHVVVETVPTLTPTRAFPMPGTTARDLGPLNPLTYRAASAAARLFAREVAEACAPLGGAGAGRAPSPAAASLVPVSPHLLPPPADWPASVVTTGAWTSPGRSPEPGPAVREFLDAGPFLYAGFGSMAAGDPVHRARAVVAAARAHGLRTLLVTGWGGLEQPRGERAPDVLAVPAVPHDAVLPRASVAVHHGGAGTVHAVARAGVPSVVVPFTADQPFWAALLHRRGLASRPVRPRHLDTAPLTAAVAQAQACHRTAQEVARAVRTDRGAEEALRVLERVVRAGGGGVSR
ncbi:glycosyltransferase [Paenibacillus sp. TRM 82003]|uniref:glycosyltransferase n=1 Tax=Kineococcus sp. TRM81007 TaxID=2925831 RepID=UPI001F572BEF|nr:glycosyltransferase [Kineococcus sp. TRM81007]MCI2236986.1 glycosyltransferase [Kineococcus sp. TRM81007]MCI3926619.1 glycosyltransferase [Paenibacillus sp. TRM 82003]